MANEQNLLPVEELNARLTPEQRSENARKAGLASAEARRKKKSMRETARMLMDMEARGGTLKQTLTDFGIEEEDQTYQTAMMVRLMQKGIVEGDTASIRLLGEMAGEIGPGGFSNDPDVIDMAYPTICIPQNGRDKLKEDILAPQPGPQTMFMTSEADVVIYGGAAGGGKTFALLLEMLRHKAVPDFQAAIFRSTYTQITAPGGLWDASGKIYSKVAGADSGKTPKLHWDFDNKQGGKLTFAHIGCEDDLNNWQGTEIAYIGFDELTHFSRHMFLYMLSRNRSTCGVRPYVRATCNPDADSWVAEFIDWWIDPNSGYPIGERSGKIRWMLNLNDVISWHDSREDAVQYAIDEGVEPREAEAIVKSVTFISSTLYDNKILMEKDPGYIANLKALTEVDMERLLYGNWKIKAAAGKYFQRTQIEIIPALPTDITYWCRAWDIAATDEDEGGDPDFTASALIGRRKNGTFVVANVTNDRIKAGNVENLIKNTAKADRARYGALYHIRLAQDPGAAGKILAKSWVKMLAGFNVKAEPISGSKELRATPFAAQWQMGNVQVLEADWNDMYFSQLESFPESKHDDLVDASSDAFNECAAADFNVNNLL